MPIYEFKCPECAHIAEFRLKFSDPAPTECPNCGKTVKMQKLISATNFHLKGGGWFKDQYNSASNRKPDDSSSGASSSAGSTSKSDSSSSGSDSSSSSSDSSSSSSDSSSSSSSGGGCAHDH